MQPKYLVTAWLSETTSVQETSKVFDGLHALARQGLIRLKVEVDAAPHEPRLVRLSAIQNGEKRRIAIDLADQAKLFSEHDLQAADVYFKRSLQPAVISTLSGELRRKIKPFGLNNPAARLATALSMLRARRRTGRSWHGLAEDGRHLLALPDPRAFEAAPESPAEPIVFLQTRLWVSQDTEFLALNEARADLVRTLRKQFGKRFAGGLVPSAYAAAHHPDLITDQPYRMRAYPHVMKRALVTVSSRGLHDSVPFKMGEYLAASRCIVAQHPAAALPAPLVDGSNYASFDTSGECVAACDRLLTMPSLARSMRHANWQYYCRESEPAAQLLARLDEAFAAAASVLSGASPEPASGERS